jgi:hypothetical protein
MHLSSSPALWYSIRASGVIAFVLLTCTVLVGVGLAGKVRLTRWPRFRVDALHRYLGTDIVIPFASCYRTTGLGLGIVATELLLALTIVEPAARQAVLTGADNLVAAAVSPQVTSGGKAKRPLPMHQ